MHDRVLVIGGTRGTGLLIVRRLLQEGYRVRALARDPAGTEASLGSAVEIVAGDVTRPETLYSPLGGATHLVFTAGVTRRPAGEQLVIATEYQGVLSTLAAARTAGLRGRFLYMTSLGATRPSFSAAVLNLVKRNTLRWRKRAEDEIRRAGLDYTIVRAGFLLDVPGGRRAIELGQEARPLAPWYRISRADVAETFVQALKHPRTSRTTFEVVWGTGPPREGWTMLFGHLKPDP